MSGDSFDFDPKTLLPPCPVSRIHRFAHDYLDYFRGEMDTHREPVIPKDYIELTTGFHGGVPRKNRFTTRKGTQRRIAIFLNYLEPSDLEGPVIPTFRRGTDNPPSRDDDIRLDYHIRRFSFDDGYFWKRIGVHFVAFAALDVGGMDAKEMRDFDLLCFDFTRPEQPGIVTWDCSKSHDETQVTEFVCGSFADLLTRVSHG